ncbi:hypothetical protein L218DRAFT_953902 [Marasmius fiardii PR-910]|nr:hypothetical protein L218DRAFT_953902 [Marasmius fiardii PR-910]
MTASAIDHGVTIAIGVFQIILAFLTGGRIWSISRQARELMGRSSNANKKHTAIVAIIIESGSLYACALFTFSVVEFTLNSDGRGEVPFGLETIVMLISGIAPTLIIVRVAYGKTVDSVHQMVSTLHFADGRDVQQGSTSERQTVVDLQLRTRSDVDVHLDMDKPFSPPAVTGEKMV